MNLKYYKTVLKGGSVLKNCFEHYQELRLEMDRWLDQSRRMDPPSHQGGGEDEANYSLSWFPHYLITGSKGVRTHFHCLLDQLSGWVNRDCLHGYEPEAEIHHGTEPFLLFLPRYLGIFPEDGKARGLLEDAAHHIGNWVEEIPAWFDWRENRFFGYHIGTRTVEQGKGSANELAEHFRFIHIALAAYRVLGEDRYFDWALGYGRRRAEMIISVPEGPLPVMWGADGEPVWEKMMLEVQAEMSGRHHHLAGDPLIGVEVLLASGVIYALGDLFQVSRENVFREAAKRIARPLIAELLDPYADPGAAAVSYYRRVFEDSSMDNEICKVINQMPSEEEGDLAMVIPGISQRTKPGVGKRADMVFWGVWNDEGSVTPVREPSTAMLTLAYQMTGDMTYAARAFRQAAARLKVARGVLRGGREHADMGGAICSVAAGHGRNWGLGAVTACYGPLIMGTREVLGMVKPTVEVRQGEANLGLPETIISLVIPPGLGTGSVRFWNGGNTKVQFSWRSEGSVWKDLELKSEEEVKILLT